MKAKLRPHNAKSGAFFAYAGLYLAQTAIAWPGLLALGLILGLILDPLGLGFLFGIPAAAPVFAGWVGMGLAAGYALNRKIQSASACFVLILPLALFAWDVRVAYSARYGLGWAGVWTEFFSRRCGGSECLNEGFVTAPLVASTAYCLGAFAALRQKVRENRTA